MLQVRRKCRKIKRLANGKRVAASFQLTANLRAIADLVSR